MIVREELGTCGADEIITPNTAKGVTSTLLKPTSGTWAGYCAVAVMLTVETAAIRFRISGTAADTSTGHLVNAGEDVTIVGGVNVNNLSIIDDTGTASSVQVSVFY